MAKRATSRPARKAAKRGTGARAGARTTARRAGPRRATARTSAAPQPVRTGRGPSPAEVARAVFPLLRDGRFTEVEATWHAPSIESVEGAGVALAWKGKKAVLAKYRGWEADHDVESMQVEGPWVGATGFCVKYVLDVHERSSGRRSHMEEIAVYTVQNGKIVREEFHFAV